MNTLENEFKKLEVQVNGFNWPKMIAGRGFLLGPASNLGRFRWYYRFWPFLGERGGLDCSKVDSSLRLIAVNRIDYSCSSQADLESQRPRLIARCIRGARPPCWP
jgi:hypothetical protein